MLAARVTLGKTTFRVSYLNKPLEAHEQCFKKLSEGLELSEQRMHWWSQGNEARWVESIELMTPYGLTCGVDFV